MLIFCNPEYKVCGLTRDLTTTLDIGFQSGNCLWPDFTDLLDYLTFPLIYKADHPVGQIILLDKHVLN